MANEPLNWKPPVLLKRDGLVGGVANRDFDSEVRNGGDVDLPAEGSGRSAGAKLIARGVKRSV